MEILNTPIGRLRAAGLLEGASFVLLLGVAMPLKYLAGMPLAVRVVGLIHGMLFIAFCSLLLQAKAAHDWSLGRAGGIFLAGLVPFGPFVIDRRLKREDVPE